MRTLNMVLLLTFISSCGSSKKSAISPNKLEIVRIDTITDHYVFSTIDASNNEVIVLAEKGEVERCRPFKKFILADSVRQTSDIKTGSHYDMIGFTVSIIDSIRIKEDNDLAKIISNCKCFSN
jgi:hypothetical protein